MTLHTKDHASQHGPSGDDPLRLDDLAAPQDNTDLNASTSAHGLLRKLSGVATELLTGAGTWVSRLFGLEWSFGSSEGVSTTTSETYQQKLRHTTGSLPSGDYLILWYFEFYDDYGNDGQCRVQLNDTTDLGETIEYDVFWANYRSTGGFYRASSISGVQNIDIDYRSGTAASTLYIRRARIAVFRVA